MLSHHFSNLFPAQNISPVMCGSFLVWYNCIFLHKNTLYSCEYWWIGSQIRLGTLPIELYKNIISFVTFWTQILGELEFLYQLNFIFVLTSPLLVCLVSFLIYLVMLTRHGPRPYTYSLRCYIRTCHYAPTWNILKSRHWTKNWLKCLLF